MSPRIEAGGEPGATGAAISAADVPQLSKQIKCTSGCTTDGCEHAYSRAELRSWLDRLRSARITIESSVAKRKAKSTFDNDEEL